MVLLGIALIVFIAALIVGQAKLLADEFNYQRQEVKKRNKK